MLKIYFTKSNKAKIYRIYAAACVLFFAAGLGIGMFGACTIDRLNLCDEMRTIDIFANNIKVGISMMCIGAVSGGVYGLGVLMMNGYIVGELVQFLRASGQEELIARGIMPHIGVELAGLTCFALIGFIPIVLLYHWVRNKQQDCTAAVLIKKTVWLLAVGSTLLLAAAVLECNISSAR